MWNLFTVGSLQFPNDSTIASSEMLMIGRGGSSISVDSTLASFISASCGESK